MNLMESRFIHLKKNLEGLLKTGIPLLEYDQEKLIPSLTFDDLGLYIIIPQIAKFFALSLEQSINLFFYGIILLSFFISIIGWFKVYTKPLNRLIAFIAIALLTYKAKSIGDTYLSYFFCINTLAPWILYYAQKKDFRKSLLFFVFITGFAISLFHYIRAFSGLGIIFFMLSLFVTSLSITKKQWIQLFLIFMLGASIPFVSFNALYNQSVNFAQKNLHTVPEKKHVFWHNLYIGFGFLQTFNPGIVYEDKCGETKVKEVDETICLANTKKYESILKHEVIKLIKHHWHFVLLTLFAKLGILFLYFLEFANIGIICAFLYPKQWNIELSFFIGTAFYGLFPLLTIPYPEYALGFISFATIYGIVSINYALLSYLKK